CRNYGAENRRNGFLNSPFPVRYRRSLLAQHQIHHPAAANVLARLSAMVQDFGVIATSLLESGGENGQAVEGTLIVDGLCEGGDVCCSPGRSDGDRAERVAEEVAEKVTLDRFGNPFSGVYGGKVYFFNCRQAICPPLQRLRAFYSCFR